MGARPQAEWLITKINENGWEIGAELGLGKAITSRKVMANTNLKLLVGVDIASKPHKKEAQLNTEKTYPLRYWLIQKSTAEACKEVENGFFDFVFIDAGHSYKAVKSDIENWLPKVKKGGMLCGHDFDHPKFPGIKKAVEEKFSTYQVDKEYKIWYI